MFVYKCNGVFMSSQSLMYCMSVNLSVCLCVPVYCFVYNCVCCVCACMEYLVFRVLAI